MVETKKCYHCGKNMIKEYTGVALMTYPAKYPMQWRCMCGHREDAGIEREETEEDRFKRKWREANP